MIDHGAKRKKRRATLYIYVSLLSDNFILSKISKGFYFQGLSINIQSICLVVSNLLCQIIQSAVTLSGKFITFFYQSRLVQPQAEPIRICQLFLRLWKTERLKQIAVVTPAIQVLVLCPKEQRTCAASCHHACCFLFSGRWAVMNNNVNSQAKLQLTASDKIKTSVPDNSWGTSCKVRGSISLIKFPCMAAIWIYETILSELVSKQ